MSGVPSTSRRPPSVVVEDASSSRVSSGTSYRPSRGSREPREIIDGVVAGGVSVVPTPPPQPNPPPQPTPPLQATPPLQPTPPQQPAPPQKPAPSRHTNPSQGQEIIAELRKEIQTLKQEAQGRKDKDQIPTKPRPTKRTHASQREDKDRPTRSRGSQHKELSETSSSQSESRSPTPPKIPKKSLNKGEPSRSRPPPYGGKSSPTKKHPSRRTARPGRQSAVWKALDLISSSPFSREIEKAKMPERFPVPRLEIYNGRTDPVTHIGHYQQTRHSNNSFLRPDGRGVRGTIYYKQPEKEGNEYPPCHKTGGQRDFERLFHQEPIYKVIEKIKREPFFVRPPKMIGNPALKDGNLYCSYHREKGHMTENCHLLKVHLEKLASAGHLDQYIDTGFSAKKEQGLDARPPHSSDTPSAGVIHVIHNPLCSAVSSASYRFKMQKAAHLRISFSIRDTVHLAPMYSVSRGGMEQVISFSDSDLRDVQLPHNNPLVVTLRIGNYDVQRVLIDQGSFAEVMYQDLYEKLGLSETELSNFTTPIFGFSGEPVVPLGKTMLPVLAGPINLQMEFIVVKASSPYNAIMGRDWLHRMKAIPSTLHQKLRFPTPEGVMELNGDQSQELEDGEAIMTEQPEKVFFDPSTPESFFLVGSKLSPLDKEELLQTLIDNRDVFAWSVYDAPGVSPNLACHSLNIEPKHRPVVQKRRKLAPERATIVLEEVERLLASGAIREVQYPCWLSNTVVVKKKNGKWRVCIDFTDLNKACPKDPFPLPRIDQLVDSASRHARATYQQMVTKMFGHMIGRTVEVYIDNMLVKSLQEEDHLADLQQVFDILRKDNLCLNASKCTFGVASGKFLGHVVSRRGIEANPDQIVALVNLAEPRNIKQVQRLTGMIAALGRFISRSADKCKPFFRLLSKRSRFVWDEECSAAFQAIKAYLSTPPCLSIPSPGEPLFLYLAVSDHTVSAVLVQELGQEQKPIFFISKVMDETELRYLPLEKAALALLHAAKKLPHYFQSSTVTVLSDLPLKMLLQRSDFTGRITRWGVHLGSLGVEYKPHTAIKGQRSGSYSLMELRILKVQGAGIVLISPEGLVLEQAVRLKFSASNNEAEYEAMLIGLRTAKKLGANHLQDDRMSAYVTVARTLLSEFDSTQVAQIGRGHNSHTDVLAKLATALETDMQRTVCIETLDQPSFQDQGASVFSISSQPSWMDPILRYLKDNRLPEDTKEAKVIKRKALRFWVSKEGLLYRRSFTGPYLLFVHPDKVRDFLFEIHEGICGSHTGGRSLAHRAISQGYWWPYMQADALKYVQECDKCQRFAPMIHQPARELNPLSSPWPFAQWGLDIVGPLPRAPGNKRFLIATTDYFTKWVEAEPLSNIRDVDTKRFLWKNIITRFGIPWAVISDNGTQFESRLFKGFCSNLSIRNLFSSPGYPQSNGQAEVSNKVILNGIKRKLEAAKGKWVEELPSILWIYRTTVRKSTNETPFALAFGVEAVIPLEIGMPTIRMTEFDVQTNEDSLLKDLDLVKEKRDSTTVHLAAYQHRLKREHNKNVKTRIFQVGDLVLRKVMANTRNPNEGKLGPNWEGPYKVLSQVGHGAYRLEDMEGKSVPRPWNTCNLRKYFF
uniref:Integrase catalytic domain-containing protein n=1 Tax=Fagus sylvatica TaxID=28930 RepID=A0A2N9HX24_FAGSY